MLFHTSLLLALSVVGIALPGCFDLCLLPESSLTDLPENLETEIERLRTLEVEDNDGLFSEDIVVGICGSDGPRFTVRFIGPFAWQYDYFDASTGAFKARTVGQADVPPFLPCVVSGTYWPRLISCPDPVVTEVIGGTRWQVGDDRLP